MKTTELAAAQEDGCCNSAIALIDPQDTTEFLARTGNPEFFYL
jgi:hypothetical protein